MSDVRQHEGDPREKEIPDQAGVPSRVGICHPGRDEKNTSQAGNVEQEKHSNAVSVAIGKVFEFVIHEIVHAGIRSSQYRPGNNPVPSGWRRLRFGAVCRD